MKKFIFLIVALAAIVCTVNAQDVRFSGNIGITTGIEPHNSNVISFPTTVNLGIGGKWSNGLYTGIGISPGVFVEHMHVKGFSQNNNCFIMPFYFQASYIKSHSWYADVKFGGEWVNSEGNNATFLFVNITPVGYTFDKHNSIGIGWRYHAKNAFNGHGITLTYQYTF